MVVFGVFHFLLFKFAVTAALGVLLAYICWQSRSIVPAMIAHFLHNSVSALSATNPEWYRLIGVDTEAERLHLPAHVLIIGGLLCVVGVLLTSRATVSRTEGPMRALADAR